MRREKEESWTLKVKEKKKKTLIHSYSLSHYVLSSKIKEKQIWTFEILVNELKKKSNLLNNKKNYSKPAAIPSFINLFF